MNWIKHELQTYLTDEDETEWQGESCLTKIKKR